MVYQMSWQPLASGELELHLRVNPLHPWRPYSEFPDLVVENEDDVMSKGWATYRKLLKTGEWEIISSG